MPNLQEILNADGKKPQVVDDCVTLIDEEVKDKGGISGLALKAGYGAVKGIKPGFVRNVVTDLLPEFALALDPFYQEAVEKKKKPSEHFVANSSRVADALLSITDGKAKNAKSGVVRSTYDKLRGTAKKNVEAALPRLGRLVEKHAPSS
ncbi:MAG TPA: hypothetical protein VGH28_19015 [Polyangiaceae bacterium]|jgi:hypothetical protein